MTNLELSAWRHFIMLKWKLCGRGPSSELTPPASAASLGYAGLLAARRNTRFARYCEDNTLADALFSQHYIIILNKKHFTRYIYDYVYKLFYKQAIFRYNSYYNSVMDYEYSVIGSVYCNAEALASVPDTPVEYTYKGYKFLLRKFSEQISVSLRGFTDSDSKANPSAFRKSARTSRNPSSPKSANSFPKSSPAPFPCARDTKSTATQTSLTAVPTTKSSKKSGLPSNLTTACKKLFKELGEGSAEDVYIHGFCHMVVHARF